MVAELKNEIAVATEMQKILYVFVEIDIAIFGYITPKTLQCFEAQKVDVPEEFKKFVK